MPEINLPIQAGHNDVLKIMKRGYTVDRYAGIIDKIRATIPEVSITTDIIVGHPGESDEHFQGTVATVERIRFGKVHIAAFSSRPDTRAAEMELDPEVGVPYWKKQLRRVELDRVQTAIQTEENAKWQDREVEVLVEEQVKGQWRGRTPQNRLVYFQDETDWTGQLVQVRITSTGPWSLKGELVTAAVPA